VSETALAKPDACCEALAVTSHDPIEAEDALRSAQARPFAVIPAGDYRPLFPAPGEATATAVPAFRLDALPVTNEEFLTFVRAVPAWRRSQTPRALADDGYLSHWSGDLDLGDATARAPVTRVSWYAARAYADWAGRRLPTTAEWERAAGADATDEEGLTARVLAWYARPTPAVPPEVGATPANRFGARDLHGLVWEWVADVGGALTTGDGRVDRDRAGGLFCGGGAAGAARPEDYASFMRLAMRSSLEARYTVRNVGFRCAADAEATAPMSADAHACCTSEPPAAEGVASTSLPTDSLYRTGGRWTDQAGRDVPLASLAGRVRVVAMIFTSCGFACPKTVESLQAIERAIPLERRDDVVFTCASFDDARDTPARLAAFAEERSLAGWTLLHGGPDDVRLLAAALGVRYQRLEGGDFAHGNRITVVDESGRILARVDGLAADTAPAIAAIRSALERTTPEARHP